MADIELTEREKAIAKEAAKIALDEMADEFYKKIGKTVVNKIFISVSYTHLTLPTNREV